VKWWDGTSKAGKAKEVFRRVIVSDGQKFLVDTAGRRVRFVEGRDGEWWL